MTRDEVVALARKVGFTQAHDYMVYQLYIEIQKYLDTKHNQLYWDTERNK